jgi:phosphate transport system substrate-binding protein
MGEKLPGIEDVGDFESSLIEQCPSSEPAPPEHPVAAEGFVGGDETVRPSAADTPGPSPDLEPSGKPAGAAPAAGGPNWMGKQLSHFRLLRLLGAGGMGSVFQAEDIHLRRMVALKVLKRRIQGMSETEAVEGFFREARAAANIDHPNIAQVFEINQHQGWWFIAMEFLEGGSLAQMLKANGPLPIATACLAAAEAARGLSEAHAMGIVHRDVKPANLMLNRLGRCKLADFGLVKIDDANDPFHFFKNRVVGSPYFVAPEVVKRQDATGASDIYSLAATLHMLLTGRPVFVADTVEKVTRLHVEAPPPDIRKAMPNCPQEVADLLTRALDKDPLARPSAQAFAAALQAQVSTALALAAHTPPPGSLVARGGDHPSGFPRTVADQPPVGPARGTWKRWAALAAATAVAAALGLWLVPRGPAKPAPVETLTNSIGMQLAMLPTGGFQMGSPPSEPDRNGDERQHEVVLTRPLAMGVTEVTQEQWSKVMGTGYLPPEGVHPNEESGRRYLGPSLPAYVSWDEAAEFCRRLGVAEGRCYRLPTEAEWEHACRAGTRSAFGSGDVLTSSLANVDIPAQDASAASNGPEAADSSAAKPKAAQPEGRPMPVASFPPNAWGLHDMHGNVMEWCADWAGEYPLESATDPEGPPTGSKRILRGGSWDAYARVARSANRLSQFPVIRTDTIGFRVVLDPGGVVPQASDLTAPTARQDPAPKATEPMEAAPPPARVEIDPGLPDYKPRAVVSTRLRSVGSDTMDRLMQLWEKAFKTWHPKMRVRHEGRGSGTAIPALNESLSHFGPMSRDLKRQEILDFQAEHGYEPTQVPVAIDALAVYVHPSNPVAKRGIDLVQLDAIYSAARKRGAQAAISTWGQLGLEGDWQDKPIHAYGRNPASGTYGVFKELVLENADYGPTIRELVGSAEVITSVANDPLGIGYSGIGYRTEAVVPLPLALEKGGEPRYPRPEDAYAGSYPLARQLYLTIDAPPDQPLPVLTREFLRFVLGRQGQKLVAEAGFFPLTAEKAKAIREGLDLE